MKSTYKFILAFTLMVISATSFAQRNEDLIVLENGQPVMCTITREFGGNVYFKLKFESNERYVYYTKIKKIVLSQKSKIYLGHLIDESGKIRETYVPMTQENINQETAIKTTVTVTDSVGVFNYTLMNAGKKLQNGANKLFASMGVSAAGSVLIYIALLSEQFVIPLLIVGSGTGIIAAVLVFLAVNDFKIAGEQLEFSGRIHK
jgi:hypothetical protein